MAYIRKIKPLKEIFTEAEIAKARSDVDHIFDNAPDRHETTRRNPYTSVCWDPRLDPIKPQKEAAVRVRDLTRGGYKEQVRGYVRDGHRCQERMQVR